MTLQRLELDDRKYADILQEALARIRVHNPEWTDFNDSDPGVTLLQLFAFMAESLWYRTTLLPDRNRSKFLRLLDIEPQAPSVARALVCFDNTKGLVQAELLPAGLELTAGNVPFRTRDALEVLPVESRVYFKERPQLTPEEEQLYNEIYNTHDPSDNGLDFYETKPLPAPSSIADMPSLDLNDPDATVDGFLWVALLARSAGEVAVTRTAIAHRVLTLGIVPAIDHAAKRLPPLGQETERGEPSLVFELPVVTFDSDDPVESARYKPVSATTTGDLTREPSLVQLELPGQEHLQTWRDAIELDAGVGPLPPMLDDAATAARVVTWLRIRAGRVQGAAGNQLQAKFSFVGINAALVEQRARVRAEQLGTGSGEPDQTATLANTPVIRDSVELYVGSERWQRVDDLGAAGPEVQRRDLRLAPGEATSQSTQPANVYVLDRKTGEVGFGDGVRGRRPPDGATLLASYDYGGGLAGMVGIGAISKGAAMPAGMKVANPIPSWGADDEETIEQAERRITSHLRHRDRLMSEQDFRDITLATPGVDVGRVEVLPLFHPQMTSVPAEGLVTVMLIPQRDARQPDAPRPDRLFLDTVCRHLNPRRLITTELHVVGPNYVPVYVSAGIEVVAGLSIAAVREDVKQAVRQFLSPLNGELIGNGWRLNHDIDERELLTVVARVSGVAKVTAVLLGDASGGAKPHVPIDGLMLPHLLGVEVQAGDPLPLDQLRGEAEPSLPSRPRVPVPVIPEHC